ncbi:MAG: 50S ribosomal protein L44e [archaeon]
MKKPKTTKRHCPFCNKHTEHTISIAKKKGKNAAHPLSHASKHRLRARGSWRGHGNMGAFSRPPIASRKMSGKKLSKKTDFRFTCKECKKTHVQNSGIRAKKVELV